MLSHEENGTLPGYDSDKAALENAGKKEVLKVGSLLGRVDSALCSILVRHSTLVS